MITTPQQREEALRLRAEGWKIDSIAVHIGRSYTCVWEMVNPELAKIRRRKWAAKEKELRRMRRRKQFPATPTTWKEAPESTWLDALVADMEEFERRMQTDDGEDCCIR